MIDGRSLETVHKAWLGVEQIHIGRIRGVQVEALLEFIEEPFKEAIGMMFEKNIPTVGSSCNIHDYSKGKAWITVDYDFMTARNKKVADRHDPVEKFTLHNRSIDRVVTVAGLLFPIESLELPEEVGARAVNLAEAFHQQPDFLPRNV
jgi:hypothetical protein